MICIYECGNTAFHETRTGYNEKEILREQEKSIWKLIAYLKIEEVKDKSENILMKVKQKYKKIQNTEGKMGS